MTTIRITAADLQEDGFCQYSKLHAKAPGEVTKIEIDPACAGQFQGFVGNKPHNFMPVEIDLSGFAFPAFDLSQIPASVTKLKFANSAIVNLTGSLPDNSQLKTLEIIECGRLVGLDLSSFVNLQSLTIVSMSGQSNLGSYVNLPATLTKLFIIGGFPALTRLEMSQNLRSLSVNGGLHGGLPSITQLNMSDIPRSLQELSIMNAGILSLTGFPSLESLRTEINLFECRNLNVDGGLIDLLESRQRVGCRIVCPPQYYEKRVAPLLDRLDAIASHAKELDPKLELDSAKKLLKDFIQKINEEGTISKFADIIDPFLAFAQQHPLALKFINNERDLLEKFPTILSVFSKPTLQEQLLEAALTVTRDESERERLERKAKESPQEFTKESVDLICEAGYGEIFATIAFPQEYTKFQLLQKAKLEILEESTPAKKILPLGKLAEISKKLDEEQKLELQKFYKNFLYPKTNPYELFESVSNGSDGIKDFLVDKVLAKKKIQNVGFSQLAAQSHVASVNTP